MGERTRSNNPQGKSRGLKRRSSEIADWETANGDILKRAIATAAFTGGALRFGYSRDGGAYAIGIYGDGDPYTEWVKPGESVDEVLEEICELFESIKDEQRAARTAPKQPKTPPPGQ